MQSAEYSVRVIHALIKVCVVGEFILSVFATREIPIVFMKIVHMALVCKISTAHLKESCLHVVYH